MKKGFIWLICLVLLGSTLTPVYAGGDKVRGEKGQGETHENGPTPRVG